MLKPMSLLVDLMKGRHRCTSLLAGSIRTPWSRCCWRRLALQTWRVASRRSRLWEAYGIARPSSGRSITATHRRASGSSSGWRTRERARTMPLPTCLRCQRAIEIAGKRCTAAAESRCLLCGAVDGHQSRCHGGGVGLATRYTRPEFCSFDQHARTHPSSSCGGRHALLAGSFFLLPTRRTVCCRAAFASRWQRARCCAPSCAP